MVDDEGGCSRAHAGLEPAIVGGEWPEEAATEEEIDVDRSAGVAGSAGDREEGCVGRDEQGSGSEESSKHDRQCLYVDFLGFCATGATRQGVEGRTLGLKNRGPHTERFYMRSDRGLVEGATGVYRGI